MIKKYIIDGNNLIGKIRINSFRSSEKQSVREKLSYILDRYFSKKKFTVSLHFDGFAGPAIKTSSLRIHYSDNRPADDFIRREIETAKNPKLITVVSSDNQLTSFAKACSCSVIKSEVFAKAIFQSNNDIEDEKIKSISSEEIKKMFGI